MWRKNSWYLGVIFLILLSSFVYAISINEIMYNPDGNDNNNEYVEIYFESYINLSNYKIQDLNSEDILKEIKFVNSNYALIVEEGFDYSNINASIYSVGATIGNGLNNDGDLIILKDTNDIIIDALHYYSEWGANDNEKSLCNANNIWQECFSTPGFGDENSCDWEIDILLDTYVFDNSNDVNWIVNVFKNSGDNTDVSVKGYVKDIMTAWQMDYMPWTNENIADYRNKEYSPNLYENKFYKIFFNITELDCSDTNLENNFDYKFIMVLPYELGNDYTKLKINELFPNPQGNDNDPIPEGEWVELYNSGEQALNLENLSLKDNYGQDYDIYISDSNTIDGTIINPNDYLIIYMNGRSGFLNNDGFEKISLYKDDFLLDEVSYSGSTEGLTWGKIDNIWQLTLPTPNSINVYNESINESTLEIENLYDDTFKFGEIIRAKVHVYKGDTDRYSIQAWIEDEDDNEISKRSRVSIYNKFTDYDLIIPIQVFSNCGKKYEEGEYDVIVEGLGLRDKEEIKLVSNVKDMCETIEKEVIKEVSTSITSLSEKDINTDYSVEYTSKEVKERRLAIYFFCVVLIMMLLYFGLSKNG